MKQMTIAHVLSAVIVIQSEVFLIQFLGTPAPEMEGTPHLCQADTLGNTHVQLKSTLCATGDAHVTDREHLLCLRSGLALLLQVSVGSSEGVQLSCVCADLLCVPEDRDPAQPCSLSVAAHGLLEIIWER